MTQTELNHALEEKMAEQSAFITELRQWSADRLLTAPPDSWHALQVTEHIIVSERGTLNYMKKKTLAPADQLETADAESSLRAENISEALQSDRQWNAPSMLPEPGGKESLEAYESQWAILHLELVAFSQTLDRAYVSKLIFRHPLGGMLTLGQVLPFLRDHIVHHRHQLRRIKARL